MAENELFAAIQKQIETTLSIKLDEARMDAGQEDKVGIYLYEACRTAVTRRVSLVDQADDLLCETITHLLTALLANEIAKGLGLPEGTYDGVTRISGYPQFEITQQAFQHIFLVWRETFWQARDLAGMADYLGAYLRYGALVFHILPGDEWSSIKDRTTYSPHSLHLEGFIHCSTLKQVIRTANRFYLGSSDLALLWIAINLVNPEIRFEDKLGEGIEFPHIYGPLNLDAVVGVTVLKRGVSGRFVLKGSFNGSDDA
jgi:uncharacterized protein (DUF952 family)